MAKLDLHKRLEQSSPLETAKLDANWTAIEDKIEELENAQQTATIENQYDDIAAMLADQNNQTTMALQYVDDATDDPTVEYDEEDETDVKYRYYEKLPTSTGILDNYRKLTNEEQQDIQFGVQKVEDQNGNEFKSALKVVYGDGFTVSKLPDGGYRVDFEGGGSQGVSLPDIYLASDYDIKGDGIDFTTGSISSGSANLTVTGASFTSADIGKVVVIRGAGTSDDYFKSYILSVTNSTQVVLEDNAVTTVSDAIGFYGTDDTEAIQTLINLVTANGGGKIIFHQGIFVIDGDLKNDVGDNNIDYNSQIYIPYQSFADINRTTISFESNIITNGQHSGIVTGRRTTNNGSVIRTTIIGSGTNPSIIASRGLMTGVLAEIYNAVTVHFKGLNFQYTPFGNVAQIGGLNWAYGYNIVADDISVNPYYDQFSDLDEHNVIDVSGIILPKRASGAFNRLKGCWVSAFTNGIVIGDHAYLYHNHTAGCVNGLRFDEMYHHAYVYGHLSQWNKIQVLINEECYFHIHDLDIEWSNYGDWFDYQYLLSDVSNLGHGIINYHISRSGLGYNNNAEFERLGGTKILCKPVTFENSSSLTVTGSTDTEKLNSLLTTLKNLGHIFYEPTSSLISYYRFNNDLVDQVSSLNGAGTSISYATGKGGDALDLAGGTNYVTVPDDDSLSFPSQAFSISFLINIDTATGTQTIINKRDASSNLEWEFQLNSGVLRMFMFSSTGNYLQINSTSMLSTSTWYHIVFTDGGSNILADKEIYINKVSETLTSTGSLGTYTGTTNTVSPLYIGTKGSSLGSNSLNGRVQRLGIWQGDLSQSEIDTNYTTEFTNENDLV
tara:strand:+ start:141 stop:2648 length:2508 start_codon:yes stop_codon:yes gene_type:complete